VPFVKGGRKLKDVPILLELYVKLQNSQESTTRSEMLAAIVKEVAGSKLNLGDEIRETLAVVRPYIYYGYALRSFAADLISSSGGTTSREIASHALRIAREIHDETRRTVALNDIDKRINQCPAFAGSDEFVKLSETLGEEFLKNASENVKVPNADHVKEEFENDESALVPFLSQLCDQIEEKNTRKGMKELVEMELSRIAYLKRSVLEEEGYYSQVMGKCTDLSAPEKALAMRRISGNIGKAGKILGEENFVIDSLDIADSIDDNFVRSWAYQDIGREVENSSVARYAFDRAVEGANEIDNPALRVITLTSMIEDYAVLAGKAPTRRFVAIIKKAIESIDNKEEREFTISNTTPSLEVLMKRGLIRKEEDTMDKPSSPSRDRAPGGGLTGPSVTKDPLKEMDGSAAGLKASEVPRAARGAHMTGMIEAGLKGLQNDTRSMLFRLRDAREMDQNRVGMLIKGFLNNTEKELRTGGEPPAIDGSMNRDIIEWLPGYGIKKIRDEESLPYLYPVYRNLRKIEAQAMRIQAQETLFLNRFISVKESLSFLQKHINEYERTVGSNPKIYKLEATFLKLLRKEEQSQNIILPSLRKDISDHWLSACELLRDYSKDPTVDLDGRIDGTLDLLDRKHMRSLKWIKEHTRNLKNLKSMVEKIDREIMGSIYETENPGSQD